MHIPKLIKSLAIAAVFAAGASQAATGELLTNGGFEATSQPAGSWDTYYQGNFAGWTPGALGVEVRNNVAGSAYQGNNFVELDTSGNSSISQAVATTAGQAYTLSFMYQDRAGVPLTSQGIEVFWGGASQGIFSTASAWTPASLTLTGLAGSTTLSFVAVGTSDSLGTSLDQVSLTTAVPEPETYAMLLAGLGMLGFVARRRKPAGA